MSDFEYNFSTKNLSLISGSIEQVDTFDPRIDSDTNDFIRMRVYNQDNQNTAMEVFQTNIFNEDGTPFYKKHKIYLYKEDFSNFKEALSQVTDYIITEKGEDIISNKKYEIKDRLEIN